MALEKYEGGKYINIYKGKFSVRVPEGTRGAVARVLEKGKNAGKTVYEMYYDSFTGKLVNVRTRDGEYGKTWEFDFKDKEEVYTLQLSYSNSYATNILKMLPNVDLTQEMKVQPDQKIEDGKTKSSLFISQNGVTLKHAYTKEHPNGLPPMVETTVRGQKVWDDTDRLAFLQAMVDRDILPQLSQEGASTIAASKVDDFGDPLNASEAGADDDF